MLLRKDDPWLEALPIPDIRNWRVLDQTGDEIGFVETLVVDRQENTFEALLIGASDRFAAKDVAVEDGVVRVRRPLNRLPHAVDDPDSFPSDFEKSYRRHFERTYRGTDFSFEDMLPAYRFGRQVASDADFAGSAFRFAEEDLRAYYVSRKLGPPFEIARDAVRFAYTLVHELRPFERGGLDRDAMQTLDGSVESTQPSQTTGAAMSNSRPGDE